MEFETENMLKEFIRRSFSPNDVNINIQNMFHKDFEYLNNKYKDSVAHIITFGKLKARMVMRDVGRVIGLSYGFVDSIAKLIPFDPSRPKSLIECINSAPRLQK